MICWAVLESFCDASKHSKTDFKNDTPPPQLISLTAAISKFSISVNTYILGVLRRVLCSLCTSWFCIFFHFLFINSNKQTAKTTCLEVTVLCFLPKISSIEHNPELSSKAAVVRVSLFLLSVMYRHIFVSVPNLK